MMDVTLMCIELQDSLVIMY